MKAWLPLWLCSVTAVLAGETRTVSVTYAFDPPQVELREGQAAITVRGCDTWFRRGEPALPFRTARILIPPGYRVANASAETPAKPVRLPGVWKVQLGRAPTITTRPNEPVGTRGSSARPGPTGAVPNAAPPAGPAQLVSVHRMLGHDVALVRLFPVQYAVASGELHFTATLKATLTLVPSGEPPGAGVPTCGQAKARARVKDFVDNPEMLPDSQPIQGQRQADAPAVFDYLIVTKARLAPVFQPLVRHKNRMGLTVKVETMENLTHLQPGRDAAEKLRNYIRHACTNWGIQYVLLGGDVGTVPCRYVYVHANERESECHLPSDLYYACLDGSWNRDGDQRWGEPTDGEQGDDVDLLAEVWIGRAPVDSVPEAANFCAKILQYDLLGNRSQSSVLLAGEYLGHFAPDIHAQGADMFEPLQPWLKTCTVRQLDDRPYTAPQWTARQALEALNASPQFVLYNGHGDRDRFMRLQPRDLASVTNQDLFIASSGGCQSGRFDNDPFSPDSIAEELVKQPGHGAVAAIFNARLGWFDPRQVWRYSGEYQAKLFEHLLGQDGHRLGEAWQTARHELLGQVETSGIMAYRWCGFEITLFGDPHLAAGIPAGPQ